MSVSKEHDVPSIHDKSNGRSNAGLFPGPQLEHLEQCAVGQFEVLLGDFTEKDRAAQASLHDVPPGRSGARAHGFRPDL